MHKILKSLLPTEEHVNSFQRLCNTQIDEMRAHDAHMKMVAKDPENYHPYPAPHSHPDILNSIVRDGDDYNIEFEIIDDTPKPSLEEKKNALISRMNAAVMKLQSELLPPPLKQRLYAIELQRIYGVNETDRTEEQREILKKHESTNAKFQSVNLAFALAESEIHDLTEENIDNWSLPLEFLK